MHICSPSEELKSMSWLDSHTVSEVVRYRAMTAPPSPSSRTPDNNTLATGDAETGLHDDEDEEGGGAALGQRLELELEASWTCSSAE
jgi:hypothetical protein